MSDLIKEADEYLEFYKEYQYDISVGYLGLIKRLVDRLKATQEAELKATIDKLVKAVSTLSDDLELSGKHLQDLGHANKQKYCDGQVKEYRDLINSVKESEQ